MREIAVGAIELRNLRNGIVRRFNASKGYDFKAISSLGNYSDLVQDMESSILKNAHVSEGLLRKLFYTTASLDTATFRTSFLDTCYRYISDNKFDRKEYLANYRKSTKPSTRKLAAIMFTDMVGYTAMMGRDEEAALMFLHKNRTIHKPIIERHNGEWLKEMGDGTLASFHSSSEAVRCAGAIQEAANKEGITLRIGIHMGEVLFEDNDVFGDGVNIASRIEAMVPSGRIWVSEAVHKSVRNKKGIETTFVREAQLKNVNQPVRIYEAKVGSLEVAGKPAKSLELAKTNRRKGILTVAAILSILVVGYFGTSYFKGTPKADEQSVEKSIAVLPFRNMSENPDNQHFCDGLMNRIVNNLSKISDLRVIPRTSVEQFRNNPPTAFEIGKKLDVNYILEGSVLRFEDRAPDIRKIDLCA